MPRGAPRLRSPSRLLRMSGSEATLSYCEFFARAVAVTRTNNAQRRRYYRKGSSHWRGKCGYNGEFYTHTAWHSAAPPTPLYIQLVSHPNNSQDIPPYTQAAGNPAQVIRGLGYTNGIDNM